MIDKIENYFGIKEPDIPQETDYKNVVKYIVGSQIASVNYYRIVFWIGVSGLIFSIVLLLILVRYNSNADLLKGLIGSTNFNIIREALPLTGSFLGNNLNLDPNKPIESIPFSELSKHENKLSELLNKDTNNYLSELKKDKIAFNLNALK